MTVIYDSTAPRKGGWIMTFGGRRFWPLDPRPNEIDIVDIAHALGNVCRYNGHCRETYSVAQHSVLVARLLIAEGREDLALTGLLHDAAEAYLADVPSPVKPFLADWGRLERGVERCVAARFGLPWPWPEAVHAADKAVLAAEGLALMSDAGHWRSLAVPPADIEIVPWGARAAKARFLVEFERARCQGDRHAQER